MAETCVISPDTSYGPLCFTLDKSNGVLNVNSLITSGSLFPEINIFVPSELKAKPCSNRLNSSNPECVLSRIGFVKSNGELNEYCFTLLVDPGASKIKIFFPLLLKDISLTSNDPPKSCSPSFSQVVIS